MPELPEVETVAKGLAPVMEGKRIQMVQVNRPNLRFAFPDGFADQLRGCKVLRVGRRAKYILFALDNDQTMLSHLGMSGCYSTLAANEVYAPHAKSKHDHVVFTLEDGAKVIYNDPRRFGFMDIFASDQIDACKFLAHLGPEPTGNALSAKQLFAKTSVRKGAIKTALLDQKLIAGLGNIYVCEALFRAKIHPFLRTCDLSLSMLETLVCHIRNVIDEAIKAGGSSLKDFSNTDGELGYFQHQFAVYGQAGASCPAPKCTGEIIRMVQAGRSSFFCPVCQTKEI